jgi:Lysine-specific metallo-endopeptidase
MSDLEVLQGQRAAKPTFSPLASGLLQRACACGRHTTSNGNECEECKRKRNSIQNTTLNFHRTGQISNSPDPSLDAERHLLTQTGPGHDFSSIPVHADVRAVKAPGAPINQFQDCPPDWQKKADDALILAREWIDNVVVGLASLTYPFPAPVAALFNRHFHITGRGYVYEVRRHFNTIHSALNNPIDFECEKKCSDSVAAYVYRIWSDVHLCPIWYNNLDRKGKANTIIHEIAHDAAGRDDEAYIWEPKYSKLSVEDAIDNADSYSNFAEEAYGP